MNITGNIGKLVNVDNPKAVYYATTYHPAWWSIIDWALLGYFTLEFVLRLINVIMRSNEKQKISYCWNSFKIQ
jgi:hypothetical protein